jgi:beta-lactam-binding protein with PASTA domain/serine/threonine protein kinase
MAWTATRSEPGYVPSTVVEDRGPNLAGALLEQRYRVDALLARGGMSSVYRGLDTRLDRPVAIKVMDHRFAADQAFVDRFEREARAAAKIHHNNVVAVHDQGLDGDNVFLVMELVDGGTLRDLLTERGALGVPLAVSIMEPVLAALAAAHRNGLVHRDVKPENVLIGTNGVVKVADFGLVRAIASVGTTSSSVILGTVAYLSPEQVTTGTATARGDVYSSGILLYEMLTGGPPYVGDTALSIAYRHVNDDVPTPGAGLPGIPPALDELVLRATRRDPSARPIDAGAFLLELERIRTTSGIPRVPVPVPLHHLVEGTVPVSAEDQARALSEAATVVPVLPMPMPSGAATTVRRVPSGFQAVGPQGTKAWLRPQLEQPPSAPVAIAPPPMQAPPPSPSYGMPPHPPTGGQPMQARPPRPPRDTKRITMITLAAVLLVALVGTATWWFAAGRWSEVPSVNGLDRASAERSLADSDLSAQIVSVHDNKVEAGKVIRTDPAGGATVLRGESVKLVVSLGRPTVPDVRPGISFEEAERAVQAAELQPRRDDGKNEYDDTVPKGKVVRLDPKAGSQLDIAAPVLIVLSKGPKPKPIPDVRGKTRDEAFDLLTEAGFEPFDAPKEFAGDIDAGKVIKTNPPANTELKDTDGKRVGVVISNAIPLPDVSQKTVDEAAAILRALTLEVEPQGLGVSGGSRVFTQSPPAGSRVPEGTKVILFALPGF